jgi:hypothetical protein
MCLAWAALKHDFSSAENYLFDAHLRKTPTFCCYLSLNHFMQIRRRRRRLIENLKLPCFADTSLTENLSKDTT